MGLLGDAFAQRNAPHSCAPHSRCALLRFRERTRCTHALCSVGGNCSRIRRFGTAPLRCAVPPLHRSACFVRNGDSTSSRLLSQPHRYRAQTVWACSFVAPCPPVAVTAERPLGGSARYFPQPTRAVAQYSTKSKSKRCDYVTLAFFSSRAPRSRFPPFPRPLRGYPPACDSSPWGAPLPRCRGSAGVACLALLAYAPGGAFPPPRGRTGALAPFVIMGRFLCSARVKTECRRHPCGSQKTCAILCNSAQPKTKSIVFTTAYALPMNYTKLLHFV